MQNMRFTPNSNEQPAQFPVALVHRLSGHPESSNLLNFPFVFTVLAILTSGLTAVGWGAAFASVPLMIAGFLLTFLGFALYGWSISAEP